MASPEWKQHLGDVIPKGNRFWPDRQSVVELFTSSDYQFADLDRDGVYELIAWNRRTFDVRCGFGIFAVRFYPEIFVRAGASYRKTWPPPDGRFPTADWKTASGNIRQLATIRPIIVVKITDK